MAVAFAAPLLLGLFPRVQLPSVVARDRRRDRHRPVGARDRRGRRGGRGGRADRARVRAVPGRPGDRVREAARPACCGSRRSASRVSFAIALAVSLGLERGRAGRHAAAGRDHPLRDVARRARPGAQGRGRDLLDVRAADHRRRVDRRLRRDHPAHDLLLGRGRRPARRCCCSARCSCSPRSCSSWCAAPSTRCASARTCCACRTRPRRSACGRRSCCSSASPRCAETLGLEAILGAFIAGAIVSLVDRDEVMTPPGLPPQARGDRLRLLHPRLLRHERRALRPRRADRVRLEPADGPGLPRRAARRARPAGARLPRRASTAGTPRSPG